MDSDLAPLDADDYVGSAQLSIAHLLGFGGFSGSIALHRAGTVSAGSISVEIQLRNCDEIVKPSIHRHSSLELRPAKVHKNSYAGVVVEPGVCTSFMTYEVVLAGIEEHFGDSWSANYDDHHARLFADTAEGAALRSVLAVEHAIFYRDGWRPDWLRLAGKRTRYCWVTTGQDFLQLIDYGLRDGARRVYTYVIVDEGLFFSETGSATSKDVVSKHAVHANAASRVRCAGTFRVVADLVSGESQVVIDNDSGTYRPSNEVLPKLQALLEDNYIGLRVRALDVCKPQPEDTLAFVGPDETNGEAAEYDGKWRWQTSLYDDLASVV